MSSPPGAFCLVLHTHLPYVLGHSTWPHGTSMLYEAAAECYLPLLRVIPAAGVRRHPPQSDDRPDADRG
jgi:predicted glycosyl hydrolase (DUF1957 family)